MAYNRGDEDKSTWQPPSREQMEILRRQPQPGLQEIPLERGPTRQHREISRVPQTHVPTPAPTSQPDKIIYH